MNRASASELLRELLTAEFAVSAADLRPEATLRDDLDLDSLDATELLQRLEECADVEIDPESVSELRTLDDVVDLLVHSAGGAAAPEISVAAQT